ncbi:MAG: hypothetical protein L0196_07540 [candidate division Zixibacteria bacterium]|nr:hypothetical protein [candidate division Zixibacteria bacterium]
MKSVMFALIFLLAASVVWAQPDARDSIILESKSVAPGVRGETDTSAYLYVKVYITNKDSLTGMMLALQQTSISGGAYAILGRPRTFGGVITTLASTIRYGAGLATAWYHSDSPDSFAAVALSDGVDPSTIEPPNAVRKTMWEIKFDSVLSNAGTFELDTVRTTVGHYTELLNTAGQDVPFNFAKSVVRVLVPDPRDSVILESKTVQPGTGHPYTTVKVYITNKDSLSFLGLSLLEKSTSGGAYGILPRNVAGNLTFGSVITPLTYFIYGSAAQFRYNNSSPDTFFVFAGGDGVDPATNEPPNATRKAVWEIKFDTVLTNVGTFELDTVHHPAFPVGPALLTTTHAVDVAAHFLKSVVTVTYPKGDFNQDLRMSAADIVTLLNCVFQSQPPPGGASCDVNCDGQASGADVVLEVQAVFNQEPFPC